MQAVGLGLAAAAAAPQNAGGGLVLSQLQHQRSVVKRGYEQPVAKLPGHRYRQAGFQLKRLLPVDLAGFGIERSDSFRMPDDQLPRFAGGNNHGRTVAGPVCRVDRGQRSPNLLSSILVESHDHAVAVVAPDQADEPFAVQERVSREAPDRDLGLVIIHEALRPDDLPFGDVQTNQVTHGAEGVNEVSTDQRSAPGSGGVA